MRARLRSAEFCKLGRLAPTDRKPMQLLEETTVLPEEIDSLGHMNVRFYMTRMEQANRVLIANLGIDEDALSGSFLRSADTYTRFRREQFEGATLHAIGGLLDGVDGVEGGMRSYVEITNPDTGDVAATFIVTTALVDSATRSALPVPVPETSAAAVLASQALLDQVFLDGPLGDFDSEPYLINGCSSASYGFSPDFADTSKKADNLAGGVSWRAEESFQTSTSEKRCGWRRIRV